MPSANGARSVATEHGVYDHMPRFIANELDPWPSIILYGDEPCSRDPHAWRDWLLSEFARRYGVNQMTDQFDDMLSSDPTEFREMVLPMVTSRINACALAAMSDNVCVCVS